MAPAEFTSFAIWSATGCRALQDPPLGQSSAAVLHHGLALMARRKEAGVQPENSLREKRAAEAARSHGKTDDAGKRTARRQQPPEGEVPLRLALNYPCCDRS
jgi:hypothetical protein